MLLALAGHAWGAVETTTVQGKVVLAGGAVATGGTISAVLSTSGSTDDLTTGASWSVFGRMAGTIDPNGNVTGLALVPNDAITPAGTYYTLTINVTSPTSLRGSVTKKCIVSTAPDPVDIGDLSCPGTPPGLTFALDSFSDVSLTAPVQQGDVLERDGAGQFRNVAPSLNCRDPRVVCVARYPGAEYDELSGVTVGNADPNRSCGSITPQPTCAPGSACAAAIALAGDGTGEPVYLLIGVGNWEECLPLDPESGGVATMTNLHVWGMGSATNMEPPVTNATDVQGGVIRVAAKTSTQFNTTDLEIAFLRCNANAWSSPEACIQGGDESASGEAPAFTRLWVHHVELIGNHDSFQVNCEGTPSSTVFAHFTLSDALLIGGADVYITKGMCIDTQNAVTKYSWSNYADDRTLAEQAQITGSAQGGTSTTVTLSSGETARDDTLALRKIVLSEGPGAGTCPAACLTGLNGTGGIDDYVSSTKVATVTGGWGGGCVPTSECDYTVAAVGMAGQSPKTNIGWYAIRASATSASTRWHKQTIDHWGVGSSAPASVPDLVRSVVNNVTGILYFNDGGPAPNVGCGATASDQSIVALALTAYASNARYQDVVLDGPSYTGYLNADVLATSCSPTVIGVGNIQNGIIEGAAQFRGSLRWVNNADPNVSIGGLVSNTSNAGALLVPDAFVSIVQAGVGATNNGTVAHVWQDQGDTLSIGRLTVAGANGAKVPITWVGTPTWLNGQPMVASFGESFPNVGSTSVAWTTGDLFCTLAHVENGTQTLTKGLLRVQAVQAGKLASICTYSSDGQTLLLKAESIDVGSTTGGKTPSLAASGPLAPGDYWLCVGSDATATLTMGGRVAVSPPVTVAGRLGTGGATCPSSIAPGSLTQVTTNIPELGLLP